MRNAGAWIALITVLVIQTKAVGQETYRGVRVEPELRCEPYDRKEYPYPQSVESEIIADIGKIYGPYTGQCFATARETDIEHILPLSKAHDSGLCSASAATKTRFARDVLNLMLASLRVNRYEKGAKDAAEWQLGRNSCWFVNRTLEVRRKYGLSNDRREAVAIERTLAGCASTEMVVLDCSFPSEAPNTPQGQLPRQDASDGWSGGTIMVTDRSLARRRGVTESRRCPGIIRRIVSCAMAMETALFASILRNLS